MYHNLYNINGYKILLLQNDIDNISVKSFINTGYINETKENLGINHLLEHVLVNGNPHCVTDCITHMNRRGIYMNASTGLNIVSYYTSGIKSDLDNMLSYIIETTLNSENIREEIIEKEKKAVVNELLQNSNNSLTRLWFSSNKNFYNYYGLQNFYNYKQQFDNLKKFNSNILKNYYDIFYKNKENVMFIISGNFNKNEILSKFQYLLNKYTSNENYQNYKNINNFENNSNFKNLSNTNIKNCFKLEKSSYYLKNDNIQNTTIILTFPSHIENTIENLITLEIISKYIKNIGMEILRAKEELIYSLDVKQAINYCGTEVQVTLNVSNENAKKTLNKFIEIVKKSFKKIYPEHLKGIIKYYNYITNKQNVDSITTFYENMYINKMFNGCKEKICEIEEFSNIYNNINEDKIKELIPKVFNLDKMLLVYTSSVSMI